MVVSFWVVRRVGVRMQSEVDLKKMVHSHGGKLCHVDLPCSDKPLAFGVKEEDSQRSIWRDTS